MKVTYTNKKLEVVPNIVTDPKRMIIEYLQRLDLTQFVSYDSDNAVQGSFRFSWIVYEETEIEFGDYNINLDLKAVYFKSDNGRFSGNMDLSSEILINLSCKGDVRNSDNDVVMSEQEIQPHLNTI